MTPTFELLSLTALYLADNRLASVDVTNIPNLRILDVDRNQIVEIAGLDLLRDMQLISWRDQKFDEKLATLAYQDCGEAHSLCLSRNLLPFFAAKLPFLNLQRLELAFAGIENLSLDFGVQMPNLRFLNLNHNGIKDLRPLLGIVKLVELHVAANRLARLRRTTTVLGKLGNALKVLDCRVNPLTVGFYDTCSQSTIVEQQLILMKNEIHEEDWEDTRESLPGKAYIMPNTDGEADQDFCHRLDEDTALKRRVYELLILGECNVLSQLDGLYVDGYMKEQDDSAWSRLLELGVLRAKQTNAPQG